MLTHFDPFLPGTPPPERVRDPRVRIDFEKKSGPLQIVFTFEETPVFPSTGGSVFFLGGSPFGAIYPRRQAEPFPRGGGFVFSSVLCASIWSHLPPRRRLCVVFFCVFLSPFGAIYARRPAEPFPCVGGFVFSSVLCASIWSHFE